MLAHVDSLGGYPALVMTMARSIRPAPGTIVDLACGKGLLSVRLASLGSVVGVDAHLPFIQAARSRAAAMRLASACRFTVADAKTFRPRHPVDLACMIGLLPAAAGAKVLRRIVRPGGHYLIDDCIRVGSSRRWTHIPTRTAIRAALTQLGDSVLAQVLVPPSTVRHQARRIQAAVTHAARALAVEAPECNGAIRNFIEGLSHSSHVLSGPLRPAIWLVRRGD